MKTHRLPVIAGALWCAIGLGPVYGRVWISEFVASNQGGLLDASGDPEDWLELCNDGPEPVDLGGWHLTDDEDELRKWVIPDVRLPVGGYLVIFASGENRRTAGDELHTNFSLSKNGEYLALVRPDGVTVEHEYAPDYPGQFEDVSFGIGQNGGTSTVVAQGAPGRAGVPASAADFAAEFTAWNSDVRGSFGGASWREVNSGVGYETSDAYGDWLGAGGDFEAEMLNQNGSLFLRLPFDLADPGEVSQMILRMRWEDGFVAYLNGTRVAASREPASPDWNSLAVSDRGSGENDDWVSFPIDLAAVTLVAGSNLLAIHGMNDAIDSADMLVFPELDVITGGVLPGGPVYHAVPTPGAANGVGTQSLPPLLSGVTSSAEEPTGGSTSPPIVVTARVQETVHPVSGVRLYHRTQFGPETMVAMVDDGTGPDVTAGDGIFAGEVPTRVLRPGHMVRWRVEAEDTMGKRGLDPAYLTPLDSDRYYGTIARNRRLVTSNLPVLHTFVQNTGAVDSRGGTRVSIYYLGRFYDNIKMDLHGQSTGGFPKKSYDIDFNKGNRFLWREGEGKVKDINLLTNWADKSKTRNTLAYEFLKRCGTVYHYAFPVRVERNGTFFSVADMVEDGDDRFLERNGLDGGGALYKMYNRLDSSTSGVSKKTRKEEGNQDLGVLVSRLDPNVNSVTRLRYAYDNLNIPATINYLAALDLTNNRDHGHKNYYLYRDTNGTGEWQPLVWDVDLCFGRNWVGGLGYFDDSFTNNALRSGPTNRLKELVFGDPTLNKMFQRRVKTLVDEQFGSPAAPVPTIENRVDELVALIDPRDDNPLTGRDDADQDYQRWESWGNQNAMRPGADRIKFEHLPTRRAQLAGLAELPAPQPAVPNVTIETVVTPDVPNPIDVNPSSGNQDHEFFVLKNRENTSVDLSGWRISGAVEFEIPPGTVIPAGAGNSTSRFVGLLHVARKPQGFRLRSTTPRRSQSRFVVGGYEGQLSARGETIAMHTKSGALVDSVTYPGDPTLAQQFLRITELQYHPTSPTPEEEAALPGVTSEDFEWIELTNVGTVVLDLGGVSFTNGIEFSFDPGVLLGPGERLILAKNPAAFSHRYPGVTETVVGPYTGLLNNDGENLRLVDGGGENVLSFGFNDRWYPPTDGEGRTLVLRDEATPWNQFDSPGAWGISFDQEGSPGEGDAGYLVHFNAWQAVEFDPADWEDPDVGSALANPDGDPYPNWMEYAFGLSPHSPDAALFEAAVVSAGDHDYLGAVVRRRTGAADLQWDLRGSSDGQNWATLPSLGVSDTPHGDGTGTWTVREQASVGESAQKLVRLRVQFVP